MNTNCFIVIRNRGKIFWQFFTDDLMAIDAFYVYSADNPEFNYSIRLSNGGYINGTVTASNPAQLPH